ncbi:hypothetical protein HYX58_02365 [Candidatus Dependentiae bacterium]|nr:hypothetical protein [Candidatus Dependentiae bacterium]
MEPMLNLNKHNDVLRYLNEMPRKMMMLHGRDNIAAFLLHDLCHEQGFNLHKGAYIVDNADFDCLKGVAGIHRLEHAKYANGNGSTIWHTPDDYSAFCSDTDFNKLVRSIEHKSIERSKGNEAQMINKLAEQLHIDKPEYYSWPIKHYNKGILLFERADGQSKELDEHILNSIHLFSFCPIA